jgi:hypothetical protein
MFREDLQKGLELVSMWEDCVNVVPSLRFDLVPYPEDHKRSLIIFGHFFPQEFFETTKWV